MTLKFLEEFLTSQCSYLQEDINNLTKWSDDWQMTFNVAKCKVMHFGSSNLQHDYNICNCKLDVVTEEKDKFG